MRTALGLRFAWATVLYALATFIPRVGLFLLLPIYARALSQAEVGIFSLLMSFAGALAIAFRLGLDATLLRFHFDHQRDLGALYATIGLLALASIALLTGVASVMMRLLLATLVRDLAVAPLVAVAITVGIGVGNSLQFVPSAWYRATEQPARYLALVGAVFAVGAAVTLWLVLEMKAGVIGALLGQLSGSAIVIALALLVVLRLPHLRFDQTIATRALAFGLPLVPHAFAGWILNVSDRWLLSWRLPLPPGEAEAQIGIYWIGYQVGYAVALLGVSVQAAWLPLVYRQADSAHRGRVVGAMLRATAGVLSAVAVALAAIGPELIEIVAGTAYAGAAPVLAIVAGASIFYGLYAVAVPVLLYERRTSTLAAVTFAAGLVNVAINLLLIPTLGIIGSALATLAANAAYAGITIRLAGRKWPLQVSWRHVVPLIVVTLTLLWLGAWLGAGVPLVARLVAAVLIGLTGVWMVRGALPVLARATRPADA